MPETVIGLFPESREAEEFVPMLANRGYGRDDVYVIGGRGWALGASGSDLVEKLSQFGVDEDERQAYVDGVSHGGTIIAARTPDERKADQIAELMREHGAIRCMHTPVQ
ncbi:MAG TPA: hypothetical protein VGR35_01445 [Tepidisphaeraceae bacterium]|nr:hypothetical protein [Tepidisphaeraceae bacterium]